MTKHPVLRLPTAEEAQRLELAEVDGFRRYMERREEIIRKERLDPLRFGWEPGMWKVGRALLGLNYGREEQREEFADWSRRMREKLGFPAPVKVLMINGGNRGSKSEFCAKVMQEMLLGGPDRKGWCLAAKQPRSLEDQQPLMYRYLPPELRGQKIMTATTYVAYKQKTGFSDNGFVLPNRSQCAFMFYTMDRADAVEGGEVDGIWNDELVPPDWVETEELRIATRDGWILVSFTPVQGYSPTVKAFHDGATVTKWSTAFLCPRDGGEPDEARAMGFDSPEAYRKAQQYGPRSVPTDVEAWLDGGSGQPEAPEGRTFDRVPRVMRCAGALKDGVMVYPRAVLFFHSNDNPYGNPAAVVNMTRGKSVEFVKERFYGLATRLQAARFPKFNVDVHVVPMDKIPKEGTNYLIGDPAKGRNFYFAWLRVVKDAVYVYREWPGSYSIPGVGVPGPWAEPDGKRPDGKRGPAQKSFGFGLLRYKAEIARLEGWEDYEKWEREHPDLEVADNRDVEEWSEQAGTREAIEGRYLDSRAASGPLVEKDRPVTLQTEFQDIGLDFDLTPGNQINDGIHEINSLLDYDEGKELGFLNSPTLYVGEDLKNMIFSLQTWTGEDGLKGACKEPVDILRYFALLDLGYWPEEAWEAVPGGYY